jgi:hypothetical protein
MRRGLNLRIRRQALQEKALQVLRLPATSDVEAMRDQVRRLNHQVEALGSQLEHVVELLERQERTSKAASPRQEPPPLEPAVRRPGT